MTLCSLCAYALPANLPFCPRCGGSCHDADSAAVELRRWEVLHQLVAHRVWDGWIGTRYLRSQIDAIKGRAEGISLAIDSSVLHARRWGISAFDALLAEPDLALRHKLLELFCGWLARDEAPVLHEHFERIKRLIPALQAGAKQSAEGTLAGPPSAWLDRLAHEHGYEASDIRRCVFATPHYWSKFAHALDAVEFDRARPRMLVGYGYGGLGAKNYERATTQFQEAIKLAPRHAPGFVGMADTLMAQQRTPDSLTYYRQAFEAGTTNVSALNNLAWFESTLELPRPPDLDLALAAARRATAVAPLSGIWDTLAEVYERRGELTSAIEAARAAVLNDPENEKYVARLARLAAAATNEFADLEHLVLISDEPVAEDEEFASLVVEVFDSEDVFDGDSAFELTTSDSGCALPVANQGKERLELEDFAGDMAAPPSMSSADDDLLDFDEVSFEMASAPSKSSRGVVAMSTDDDLLDIFDHPPELAQVRGTEAGDFQHVPAAPRETVDCSAFAPSSAAPAEPFLVQVYLHVPAQAEEAAVLAKESDADATRRGRTSLATQIARGSSLAFELTCKHAEIDEPYQTTVWQGVTQSVSFFVTPPNSTGIALPVKIAVFQDRAPIGQIRFTMPVRQTQGGPVERTIVGEATRFRTAFASYASPDRAEVLRRVQMLRLAGVKCFQDVLDLEPGQRWEQQLWKHIDEADVLFLFWSQHAKSSKWVTEEWRYGVKRRGIDFIRPVVLQRQPFIEPPAELCELHFNDRVLSLIDDL